MPVYADPTLPAVSDLAAEGVEILPLSDAPADALRVGLLNLMPLKEMAETDMLRVLSSTQLPVVLTLVSLRTHVPRHTSPDYMAAHYEPWRDDMAPRIRRVYRQRCAARESGFRRRQLLA